MKRVIIPGFEHAHSLYAGSYVLEGQGFPGFRLSLLAEMSLPCDINFPIADFSVPDKDSFIACAAGILDKLAQGEHVFVGCFAGRGRTGLFLAGMARLAGLEDSIGWLRQTYNPKSPETPEQEDFVRSLPVGLLATAQGRLEFTGQKNSQGGRHVRFG